jgi:hypothetical protein
MKPVKDCLKEGREGIKKSNRGDEFDQSTFCA